MADAITDPTGAPDPLAAARKPYWRAARQAGPVLLVMAIAVGSVALSVLTIGMDFEKSYNEGWNAYHAARVAAGEALYSGDAFRLVNYPFLSFFLVAWLKPLFGNVLIIGRALNLLSLGIVIGGSALIVRRLGGKALDMVFAAACVLGFQQVQAAGWIATDEPQMLAEAAMIMGLLCYVFGRRSLWRLAATALLLATGGFIKHILIAIPAAITLDILWHERRLFVTWCLCLGAAILIYLGLTYWIAGGDFMHEMWAPRVSHWSRLTYHPKKFLIYLKIPFLVSLIYLLRWVPHERAVLLRSYGAVAFLSAVLLSVGDGVSYNIFLDMAVFMGIAAGLTLAAWSRRFSLGWVGFLAAAALPIVIAEPIVTRSPTSLAPLVNYTRSMRQLAGNEAAFQAVKAALREHEGPAICESLLLCFEAGKPLILDPFLTQTMIMAHRLDEASLIRDIADHRFAVIELPARIYPDPRQPGRIEPYLLNPQRFTENTIHAIERYYEPLPPIGGDVLYLPRPN